MAYVRAHSFEIGEPVNFDSDYGSISALEYMLGAIGADIVNGLRLLARKRRISIDNVEAAVSGELNNPLAYLGVVGEAGTPGMERVTVRVYINSSAEEDDLRLLWKEALEKSPIVRAFSNSLNLELSFQADI